MTEVNKKLLEVMTKIEKHLSEVSEPALAITMEDAAHRLSIGMTKFKELRSKGEIKVIRIDGAIRVPIESLREYIKNQLGEAS